MHVAVTGANGFLGRVLTRRLVERGDAVRCLVRRGADLEGLRGLPVELAEGDVTRPETLAAAVAGAQVVFHLAGLRRAPSRERFFEVNAEGTRNVCEAIVRSGSGARLVLCSSLAASGPSREAPSEERPLRPHDWYGESKAEAERIARSYGERLALTIARPSRILGPGDRENLLVFRLVARGIRLVIGGPPRPFSTIDVEDVAEAILRLGDRPEALGEAFFVSRDTTTLPELEDVIARALGVRTRTLWIPETGLRAGAWLADGVSKALGVRLPVNRKLAQQLLVPGWTCSTRKAEARLGFVARVPLADSVAASAAWYRAQGWL